MTSQEESTTTTTTTTTTTSAVGQEEIPCTEPIKNLKHLDGKMPWGEERDAERPCFAMFLEHAARTPDAPCLGGRHHEKKSKNDENEGQEESKKARKWENKFRYQTYEETRNHVLALALGMKRQFDIKEGQHVAVFAPCSVRCFEMSLLTSALRCAIVPVNENSSPEGIATIVRNSEACIAVVAAPEDSATVRAFDELLPGRVVLLKGGIREAGAPHMTLADVASVGRETDEYQKFVAEVKDAYDAGTLEQPPAAEPMDVITPEEAVEREERLKRRRYDSETVKRVVDAWPLPKPEMEDLCILMYTSGTTGTPKGVMMTQGNLTAGVAGFHATVGFRLWHRTRWVYYNMLPLAHIYGVAVAYVFIRLGGSVAFFSGDRRELLGEMKIVKPVVIAAVPRVYQKVYEGIMSKINSMSWFTRTIFWTAYAWRRRQLNNGGYYTYADGVFSAIREQFGGEVGIALNGGAPIPREISEFLHVTLTHEFYDGYGMTETSAAGIRSESCDTLDNIGLLTPFYNTEMKVLSVPEMGYLSTDEPPRGELLIRGPQICLRGYYHDPAATALAFDSEGYVHTGDIVALVQPSKVRIIDRRNNLFKLAQGEYVYGEAVEGLLLQSPYIASIFVHGDSTQPYPVAIVVPDEANIMKWAADHPELADAVAAHDMTAICKSQIVKDFILSEITRLSKSGGLKGYEFIHQIYLHEIPFDEARGLVSASLKLKRHVIKTFFAEQLAELCALNH